MICISMSKELLKNADEIYDSKEHLLYMPITRKPYLSKIKEDKAHHILESAEYALYLFACEKDKIKANSILSAVFSNQIVDRQSALLGYWNYYSEEKIETIDVFNAERNDRIGIEQNGKIAVVLMQIIKYYSSSLSDELLKSIYDRLLTTIFTFMTDYDEKDMTTVMSFVYSLFCFGEMYGNTSCIEYGTEILKSLYDATVFNDSFYEFIDLSNFIYTSELISVILRDVKTEQCISYCNYLYIKLWENISKQYHAATGQFAGPISMTDSDFIEKELRNFLLLATGEKTYDENQYSYLSACPLKYRQNFIKRNVDIFEQKLISSGLLFPYFRPSVVATTYMQPKYSIGTFNRELFWRKRKPIIGYFGNEKNNYCFKVDVLHNFFPFASGALHSVQYRGYALGHITFLTDRGDKHIDLDGPSACVEASDLRIRFSVNGDIGKLKISQEENGIKIVYGDIVLNYCVSYVDFDGYETQICQSGTKDTYYFDIVIYSGNKRKINFDKMKKAIACFDILISSNNREKIGVINKVDDKDIVSELNLDSFSLSLSTPLKPGKEIICLTQDKQLIEGKKIEKQLRALENSYANYGIINYMMGFEESKIESNEKILKRITNIKTQEVEELFKNVSDVVTAIIRENYSDEYKKELLSLVVDNVLENIQKRDFKLGEYANSLEKHIFRKIVFSNDIKGIADSVMQLVTALRSKIAEQKRTYKKNEQTKMILQIIDDNILNPHLSLNYISNIIGISEQQISMIFSKQMGVKYVEYIQSKKIDKAIKLIEDEGMTIKEVSEVLQYSSPNSFMRMFKKVQGMTVSEYFNDRKSQK